MPIELIHHIPDFTQSHVRSTPDLDDDIDGARQHLASMHQRISQRFYESIVGPILAIGFSKTEEGASVTATNDRANIIEPQSDKAGLQKQIRHCPNALADGYVGRSKRFMDPHPRQSKLRHAVILEADHRIGVFPDELQTRACLRTTTPSLESEWDCGEHQY